MAVGLEVRCMHICSPCRLIAIPRNHTCIEWDLHQKRAIPTTTL